MNPSLLIGDEKQKYEAEFLDFLIEKINHEGGSIQFQYLFGIVLQLKSEIREAFGTTKKEIMKFLRAHPQVFKIDSKGAVTLSVPSTSEDHNSINIAVKNSNLIYRNTKPPQIENGRGFVSKISDDFGFIKANYPFETSVFFTPLEYGANKDSLLTELDLQQKSEVFFNAIYRGHKDFEVEYMATKVWRCEPKRNNKNSYSKSFKNEHNNKLKGEDVKILNEKESEAVRPFAVCNKELEMTTQAVEVRERSKLHGQPSSHSVTNEKATIKTKLKNQNGKIFPYPNGAVIKFGENFSEVANCDSCQYFLYGTRVSVSDIDSEFCKGYNIFFDAIKTETGWKAVIAWVGEEPDHSRTAIEKRNEIHEDQNCQSISDVSSESSYSSARSETKCENFHVNKSKKVSQSPEPEWNGILNFDYNEPVQNFSIIENKSDIDSSEECWINSDDDKDFEKHSSKHFTKGNKNDCTSRFKFKDSLDEEVINSDSERKSWETHYLEGLVKYPKDKARIMKHKEIEGKITRVYCKRAIVNSPCLQKEVDFIHNTFYLDGKPLDEHNIFNLREAIDIGDIIKFNCFEIIDNKGNLYQKVTKAWKGPKPTLFVTETLFELTPEQFIAELELSVSVTYESDNECIQESMGPNSTFTNPNCTGANNRLDFNSQIKEAPLCSVSEDIKDVSEDDELQYPIQTIRRNEETDELNLHCELLSERIIQKLKCNGFISNPEADLSIAKNEVLNLILESSFSKETLNQEQSLKSFCPGDSSQNLCSNCAKRYKLTRNITADTEVQTIFTGKVVGTSVYYS